MTEEDEIHKLLMTVTRTSDEVGRLDACMDIIYKLCEVTKEEKDIILAALRTARGRLYMKGENAYWEIDRLFQEEVEE